MARSSSSFKPGNPGGPGRTKGTKNRKTIILQELEKDGSALACAIKAAALTGDTSAMSLWLTRLEPAVRVRGETIEMDFDVNAPLEDQLKKVLQAIVDGEISVDVGSMLINNIEKLANIRAAAGLGDMESNLIQAFREMANKVPV
jgi:NADPH:quinone reductase-like Zn-dependent oxidoreductase